MVKSVYFDHNATTAADSDVKAKVGDWLGAYGNPSSIHWAGRGPKAILRESRQQLAKLLGVEALELVFTSGGSEANNLALKGVIHLGRKQVIISAVEHPSVLKAAEELERMGAQVDRVDVDRDGRLDMGRLQSFLSEKTALVSIMLANNETGHIFPTKEIVRMAHAVGALVHCDAVQALGKMELNLPELGVDLASLSGHKFYALKGCGVLYVRRGLSLNSLIHGGGQERGRRAGTENLLGIASLGLMASKGVKIVVEAERLRALRDHLEDRILEEIPDVAITGRAQARLPNTSSMVLGGVDGETLMMNLDVRGFAVSTGAACSAGSPEPSPTLLAMGLTRAEAQSSLRLSLGWENTTEEVNDFVEALKTVVTRLRGFSHGEKYAYGV